MTEQKLFDRKRNNKNDGGINDGGSNDGGSNDGGSNDGGSNDGGSDDDRKLPFRDPIIPMEREPHMFDDMSSLVALQDPKSLGQERGTEQLEKKLEKKRETCCKSQAKRRAKLKLEQPPKATIATLSEQLTGLTEQVQDIHQFLLVTNSSLAGYGEQQPNFTVETTLEKEVTSTKMVATLEKEVTSTEMVGIPQFIGEVPSGKEWWFLIMSKVVYYCWTSKELSYCLQPIVL